MNQEPTQNPIRRRESFEVMLRRFNREIQQSGLLSTLKKRRFRSKELPRPVKRTLAIRKAEIRRRLRGW